MFDPNVVIAAKRHARQEYPKESCGLVVEDNGAQVYLPCKNIAVDPHLDFAISDEDYFLAYELGLKGVIHSHPDGKRQPSLADMKSQISMDVAWGLLVVTKELVSEMICWGGDTPTPPLLNRDFVHGITDCYALVRDYYRLEHGLLMPDYPRDAMWWDKGQDLYMDNLVKEGFEVITGEEPRKGDGFLCRIFSSVNNHAGVYLGDGLIMHHLQNRLSRTEPVYGWKKYIMVWLRHKSFF